jgi:hypothetical protein
MGKIWAWNHLGQQLAEQQLQQQQISAPDAMIPSTVLLRRLTAAP